MLPRFHVLLISSTPVVQSFFASFSESEGYALTLTTEPKDALLLYNGDHPCDAVVLDVATLPSRDTGLLKRIATHVAHKALWLLTPLGITPADDFLQEMGVMQIIRGPLQRHDLTRITRSLSDRETAFHVASNCERSLPAGDISFIL
jgi:DNA-binding response OmpR family regulator